MKRTIVWVAALGLAVSGCAASTTATKAPEKPGAPTSSSSTDDPTIDDTSSPTPTEIPTAKVGETLNVTTDDSAGTITLLAVRVVAPGQYDTKADNGRYIQVVLAAKGTTGTFSINPYDFALVDADGQEYDQSYVDAAKGPDLRARDLHVGQKAKGSIIYDAAKGPLTLAYRGGGFGDEDVAAWELGK